MYKFKIEALSEIEQLYQKNLIDLYYGDESHICSEGYVPYGWQFADEDVSIPSQRVFRLNIFGLISRDNECLWENTQANINSKFVVDFFERMSLSIRKATFVVLDNASIHKSKLFRSQMKYWEDRGLYIFYLPPYSPHLNIAETLWITPKDYQDDETIAYATNRCLANVGQNLEIKFSEFNIN